MIEEKDELQPQRSKITPDNQRENAGSQEKNYERKPAYHAGRDGSGYQTRESNPTTPGRRPRIKDSRSVNYNRSPFSSNNRIPPGENRGEGHSAYHSQSSGTEERRPYQPQERRPHQSQSFGSEERRPYQPPRFSQSYGSSGERGERREYTPYPAPNAERGGYQRRERVGGGNSYNANRPPQQGQSNRPSYGGNNRGGDRFPNRRPPQQRTPGYNPNAKYNFQKQLKYKEALSDPNEPIRLNKFLANAGVCSRREADEFIQAGVVKVNGNAITELGTKISRMDTVLFHDRPVQIESKLYVLLNKPKNCVTTSDDPNERLTVMDLVKNACKERIYPVGRLDRNTTGVLLLTNDGDLASKLTHPSFKKKKIYHVWLDKDVAIEDMEKLANGLELEDGEIHADAISYANEEDKRQVGIEIHSGRNRVVRRMFESLGYRVIKLDRVYFAGLTKKNLPRGKWRYLSEKDVNALRMGAFE
ncbi:MAG: RNA-binding S4 domain-containing protein [Tannerella sp.]|jgi:23S rRNA pseudouridine2605 synthase|nr:RNA-binding S4 domain-containing protein [Tannerella sp.]